ncbi:MAG TPA: phosphatase PAP2 family protein [Abditibacteriaceae bacterium]
MPPLFPRFMLAWFVVFVVLVLFFASLRSRVRKQVKGLDDNIRAWASRLRYSAEKDLTNEETRRERMALSWFFRFWTNFASAPSLSTWSLVIPFAILYRDGFETQRPISQVAAWILPGLCYSGSMLLSFVIKRVFRRVRPPRPGKAFGHKLKDASFPSGHSLTSFCFWTMFTLVLVQSTVVPTALIIALAFLAATIIVLTGLSRIYLGVHFPSDVLGGFFMGILWCGAFYFAVQPVVADVLRRI